MIVKVEKQACFAVPKEPIVSGTVGTRYAEFEFSEDWKGLDAMAVFQTSFGVGRVMEIIDNKCEIPWEVMEKPGNIKVGIIGIKGDTRYPTIWSQPIPVIQGAVANGGKSGIYSRAFLEATLERARQSAADAAAYVSQCVQIMQRFSGTLDIKGTYATLADLIDAVTDPKQGDVYNVGSSEPYTIYMWDETFSPQWIDCGQLLAIEQGSVDYDKLSEDVQAYLTKGYFVIRNENDLRTFASSNGKRACFAADVTLTQDVVVQNKKVIEGFGHVVNLNGHELCFDAYIDARVTGLSFSGGDAYNPDSILRLSGMFSCLYDFGYANYLNCIVTTTSFSGRTATESSTIKFFGMMRSDFTIQKDTNGYITSLQISVGRKEYGNFTVGGAYQAIKIFDSVIEHGSIAMSNNSDYPILFEHCYIEDDAITGYRIFKGCSVHDNSSYGSAVPWAIDTYIDYKAYYKRVGMQYPSTQDYIYRVPTGTYVTPVADATAANGYKYSCATSGNSLASVTIVPSSIIKPIMAKYGAVTISFDAEVSLISGTAGNNFAVTSSISNTYYSFQNSGRISITITDPGASSFVAYLVNNNKTFKYEYSFKDIVVTGGYVAHLPPINNPYGDIYTTLTLPAAAMDGMECWCSDIKMKVTYYAGSWYKPDGTALSV